MCLRATTAHEAGILCGSRQHVTGTPGRGGPCVQKPLVAPYAGPFLVVSKGAKTFQVGQRQELVSMDHLKAHTRARYLL